MLSPTDEETGKSGGITLGSVDKKELADNLDIGDALNIADHLSQGYLEWCPEAEWVLRAQHARIEELRATVRSFFEDFIDIREESDSGRVFAPITISSCRCMMIEPLADVLAKMRTLSGAKKRSEK